MPEILYLSTAKLNRWPTKRTLRSTLNRRLGGELGGGAIPGKLTVSPEGPATDVPREIDLDYRHAQYVLDELGRSSRSPRGVTDTLVGPGQYFHFSGMMRYGRVHRDTARNSSAPSANIVFFVGAFDEPDPSVDVLLGGWIGHIVEHRGTFDYSQRMGSQTEHLYDLWDELIESEREGAFIVPEVWRRLRREPTPDAAPTLASLSRSVHSWMSDGLPSTNVAYLKGTAQCLDRLDDDIYDRALVLGTPLIIEFSAR